MKLRKAKNSDVPQIRALINKMAARTDADNKAGHMLPRSLTELYEHVRDYTVLEDGQNNVAGCCALQSTWESIAELKALAVDDHMQGAGWGRKLVEATLSEADALGIDCVFTLTNKMEFFVRLRFVPIDMRLLPQRVWSECTRCPKFMVACDEVAMTFEGRQPRQTHIPALGVNAPEAARIALGLPLSLAEGQEAMPYLSEGLTGANDAVSHSSQQESGTVPGRRMTGVMTTDGLHPPFRPTNPLPDSDCL